MYRGTACCCVGSFGGGGFDVTPMILWAKKIRLGCKNFDGCPRCPCRPSHSHSSSFPCTHCFPNHLDCCFLCCFPLNLPLETSVVPLGLLHHHHHHHHHHHYHRPIPNARHLHPPRAHFQSILVLASPQHGLDVFEVRD